MAEHRWRGSALTLLSIAGGASLAVVPASALSVAAHTMDLSGAGAVAVALTAGTFAAQVVSAWFVEAVLSRPGHRVVAIPVAVQVAALVAAVALAAVPAVPVVVLALPLLQIALEVGRSVGVAERRDRVEIVAASAVGIGCVAAVALGFLRWPWAFAPLAVGVAVAGLVRFSRTRAKADPVPVAVRAWVTADVALTGVVYPVLNSVILAALGPAAAFLFASVSTISGLVAIPLNFLRVRLLKAHSTGDTVLASAAVVAALVAIAVAEALGLFRILFGAPLAGAWLALGVACAWRVASLATTLPFASLRRRGAVRILLLLRAVCAAATTGLALAALVTGRVEAVFGALLVGELLQAAVYETARRRMRTEGG